MSESAPASDVSWRSIYILGAASAVLVLAGTLLDFVLASVPSWQASTAPTSVVLWLAQFEATPLLGLRNLDLLNSSRGGWASTRGREKVPTGGRGKVPTPRLT